ncbi:transposase [Streptomyces sp. NPDC051064]|uniref:transposase n=1 Tax=Streptomyces sp. NPDC051064 TaxID=3365641 RepID=UPI0037A6CEE5
MRRHLQEIRASGKPAPDKPKTLTVRTATWLITSHPDHLDESSTLKLKKLLARCPELDAVAACVRSFAAMMTERQGSDLEIWLTSAEGTQMKPLQSLARGLRQDFEAVTAGLTLEWNAGKVEGYVNRAIPRNQNCQACGALPCWTSTIGSRVTPSGMSSGRDVGQSPGRQ